MNKKLNEGFVHEIKKELESNILPFWIEKMQDPTGGFFGRIDGEGYLHKEAEKSAVLNTRILWSFSAAYRVLGKPEYLTMATRAKDYLIEHFIDRKYGGIYWSVDRKGNHKNTKKQFYALGFAIYGLSEYARTTGDESALKEAINLYKCIEKYSFDSKKNGYIEANTRDWQEIADMRLGEKDVNVKTTMNTHLHIIESYVNLYRVWKDEKLKERIINLLNLFACKIYNPETGHLGLFFDDDWNNIDKGFSYGHDIEGSWLLMDAAMVIGDEFILSKMKPIIHHVAKAGIEGVQKDGSTIYACHRDGTKDLDRHWWVQAETVVGSLWSWKHFDESEAFDIAIHCWNYIKTHIIDKDCGEWFWSCYDNGTPNRIDDKAGFWKCPYHNSRMCLEVLEWNN